MANPYDQMKTVNTSLESALNTLNEKDTSTNCMAKTLRRTRS